MKTKMLAIAMLSVMFAAAAGAAEPGTQAAAPTALQSEKAGRTAGFKENLEKIDAIQLETLDVDAQYWAWDIQNTGRTTYSQLQENGKRWIMKPGTRDLLFKKIKAYLDAGAVPALTGAQRAKLDAGKRRVQSILSPGKDDAKLVASLTEDFCIDLKARYWAKRIQDGETEILGHAKKSWPLSREQRAKMVPAIEKKTGEKLENLTKEELYTMDACTTKLHGR